MIFWPVARMASRVRDVKSALGRGVIKRAPTQIAIGPSRKANQAWKYEGGVIARAPSIYLGPGQHKYWDPKSSGAVLMPRRRQESNFFITVNTNKATGDDGEMTRAAHCADEMVDALASETILPRYLRFGPRDPFFRGDRAQDVVESVDWRANVEVGEQFHRIHAHIYLKIIHYSQLQIDAGKLGKFARRAWNACVRDHDDPLYAEKSFYVHIKLNDQSNWQTILPQYMAKAL